jgi:putative DNA methylase
MESFSKHDVILVGDPLSSRDLYRGALDDYGGGMAIQDQRLIERGFPCHQVGAETQRERDTGQAPPINRLHVWWARRPLTPSRAAIVASLDHADTDPETFVRQLGIERVQALVHDEPWTLDEPLRARVRREASGAEVLPVDAVLLRVLQKEDNRRSDNRHLIDRIIEKDPTLSADPVLIRWAEESKPLPQPWPAEEEVLSVRRVIGDPAHVNARIEFARSDAVKAIVGREIKWAPEDLYG